MRSSAAHFGRIVERLRRLNILVARSATLPGRFSARVTGSQARERRLRDRQAVEFRADSPPDDTFLFSLTRLEAAFEGVLLSSWSGGGSD